jgi:hypothetical protein
MFVVAIVFAIAWVVILVRMEDGAGICFCVAVICVVIGASSCSNHKTSVRNHDYVAQPASQACTQTNARPLPTAATLGTMQDDRLGPIYPCYYLLDEGVTPGRPMALAGGLSEQVFTSSFYRAHSEWGAGFLFLLGGAGGSSNASGGTIRNDKYAFEAQTSDGDYIKLVIDSENVALAYCNDGTPGCKPSVTITPSSEQPLFTKLNNGNRHTSIWTPNVWDGPVSAVSTADGPKFPGQVVEALARVTLTMPKSIQPVPVK